MEFPNSFFEDEVRDGFYVPSIMKLAWAAQLEVLETIDRICKKHNIQYFAQWGTLLGAVRHHGFIPWDDDLDICMKRPDYNRFIEVAPKELSGEYSILSIANDEEFKEYLIRVLNTRQLHLDDEFLEEFHQFPYVAGVDIFPWDYISRKQEEDKFQRQMITIVSGVADAFQSGFDVKEAHENLREIERLCNIRIDRNKSIPQQLRMLCDHLFGVYKAKDADNITLMPLWTNGDNYKFPKSYFDDFVMMPFENIEIPVPIEYDAILKHSYGNYMQPVHNWDSHDYPFYCKLESNLKEICDVVPYEYEVPDYVELQTQRAQRCEKQDSPYLQAKNIIEVMQEAHQAVKNAFDQDEQSAAATLLEDCQAAAISVGTLLEQVYTNATVNEKGNGEIKGTIVKTVSMLERYCEAVFHLHEKAGEGEDFTACKDIFMELCDILNVVTGMIDRMLENTKLRKEIVFLTYKAEYWSSFADIWKAACEEPENEVYVIPIPYYEKTFKRKLMNMHYDIDGYPEEVTLTAYDAYDFEKRMPDMVFIQNPFDEYNCATSVQPFFYASNIRKYTDCLVYVPYLMTDEIDARDERAVKMMDYYVKMPGVVLADKVCVQSEAMRNLYIDVLTKAVGEESREIWEQQIFGIGNPKAEQQTKRLEDIDIPEDWKMYRKGKDGKDKAVVLYNISPGNFVHYGEEMLAKIEDVLAEFKKNKEKIVLIWYNEKMVSELIKKKNPAVWKAYEQMVEEYRTAGWGIYDNSGNLARALTFSDAYYGDNGKMMNAFRRENKLVMCQNVEIN